MPQASVAPASYPDPSSATGELFLEVLEAENITGDRLSAADGYCLAICEGQCGVTNIVYNRSDPAWGAHSSYRSFRFPFVHPYSSACVCMLESDTHKTAGFHRRFTSDDIIGRVVIRIGELFAHTVYDCTWPQGWEPRSSTCTAYLHVHSTPERPPASTCVCMRAGWYPLDEHALPSTSGLAKVPALRLRFWVVFDSDVTRTLSYLKPRCEQPTHQVPIKTALPIRSKSFHKGGKHALFDSHVPGKYKWRVLRSHIDEIQQVWPKVVEGLSAFELVLFWRPGSIYLSVTMLLGMQFLISRPSYIPSAICVALVLNLRRTYHNARRDHRHQIHRRPGFWQIVGTALSGILSEPMKATLLGSLERLPSPLQKRLGLLEAGQGTHPKLAKYSSTYFSVDPNSPEAVLLRAEEEARAQAEYDGGSDAADDAAERQKCLLLGVTEMEAHMRTVQWEVERYCAQPNQSIIWNEVASVFDAAMATTAPPSPDTGGGGKPADDRESAWQRELCTLQSVECILKHARAHDAAIKNKNALKVSKDGIVAPWLGPVQEFLWVYAIRPLRGAIHLHAWDDPFFTTFVYVCLCGLAIVLALVPWGFVLYWGLRLLFLALFGPHMHLVGRRLRAKAEAARKADVEWAVLGAAEKERRLEEHRHQLIRAELDTRLAAVAALSAAQRQRTFDRASTIQGCRLLTVPSERRECRIKASIPADPERSSARPLGGHVHRRSDSEWGRLDPAGQALEEEEEEIQEQGILSHLIAAAKQATGGALEATGGATEAVLGAANAITTKAGEATGSVGQTVMKPVGQAIAKAKEATGGAIEVVLEAEGAAAAKAGEAIGAVGQKVRGAAEEVHELEKKAVERIGRLVKTTSSKDSVEAAGKASSTTPSPVSPAPTGGASGSLTPSPRKVSSMERLRFRGFGSRSKSKS